MCLVTVCLEAAAAHVGIFACGQLHPAEVLNRPQMGLPLAGSNLVCG